MKDGQRPAEVLQRRLVNQNGGGKTGANFVTLITWTPGVQRTGWFSRSEPLKVFVNPKAVRISSASGNPDYTKNESRNQLHQRCLPGRPAPRGAR